MYAIRASIKKKKKDERLCETIVKIKYPKPNKNMDALMNILS